MASKPTVQTVTAQAQNVAFQVNKATDQLADAIVPLLPKDGSEAMTGNLQMNDNKITGLKAPTSANDAARLQDLADSDATGAASAQLKLDLANTASGFGADLVGDTVRASDLLSTDPGKGVDLVGNVSNKLVFRDNLIIRFDTLAAMKVDTKLVVGNICRTAGRLTAGDGGGALYKVEADGGGPYNEGSLIELTGTSLQASIIVEDNLIHVKQFGAPTNGVDSDVTYIKAALDYAGAYSKVVFGRYVYTIDSAIETTLSGYNFIDAEGTYFNCTFDGIAFDFNVTGIGQLPWLRWRGGRFVNSAGTKLASSAMYFEEWRNVKVTDARFEGFFKSIISVDRDTFTFQNNHFYDNTHNIYFDNTLSAGSWGNLILNVIDNHFSNTSSLSVVYAEGVIGSVNIEKNSFNGASATGNNIHIKNTATNDIRGIAILDNHFEQGVAGQNYVYIEDASAGVHPYRAVRICGNRFFDDGPDAVVIENVWNPDISGNNFSQSTSTPIDIDANCIGIDIGNNSFSTGTVVFACARSEISMFPYNITRSDFYPVTGYDGDSFSTGSATIDMSSAIATIFPVNITPKGYHVIVQAMDSGSAAGNTVRVDLAKDNTITSANRFMVKVGGASNDNPICNAGYVPCDGNGDIYFNCIASGAGTLDVWIAITGIVL